MSEQNPQIKVARNLIQIREYDLARDLLRKSKDPAAQELTARLGNRRTPKDTGAAGADQAKVALRLEKIGEAELAKALLRDKTAPEAVQTYQKLLKRYPDRRGFPVTILAVVVLIVIVAAVGVVLLMNNRDDIGSNSGDTVAEEVALSQQELDAASTGAAIVDAVLETPLATQAPATASPDLTMTFLAEPAIAGDNLLIRGGREGFIFLSSGLILPEIDSSDPLVLYNQDGQPVKELISEPLAGDFDLELSDGRLLFSNQGTLTLWSPEGDYLTTLEGHTALITKVVELSDGRLLSTSLDETARLWQSDGTPIQTLEGHSDDVWGALELRDGRLLTWSQDKTLRLWTSDGDPLQVLEGHTERVWGALELRDGRLVSWDQNANTNLWTTEGDLIQTLEGQAGGVTELDDGRLLGSGVTQGFIIWSADGTRINQMEEEIGILMGTVELRDGRFLSWDSNSLIRLWTSDGLPLLVLQGHDSGSINGVLELANGRLLTWGSDKTLRVWSSDMTPLHILEGHDSSIVGAVQFEDGRILSWDLNGDLRQWPSDMIAQLPTFNLQPTQSSGLDQTRTAIAIENQAALGQLTETAIARANAPTPTFPVDLSGAMPLPVQATGAFVTVNLPEGWQSIAVQDLALIAVDPTTDLAAFMQEGVSTPTTVSLALSRVNLGSQNAESMAAQGYEVSEPMTFEFGGKYFSGFFATGATEDRITFTIGSEEIGSLYGIFITPPGQLDNWEATFFAILASITIVES
ncbi:MAG: hypothetical protein SF029_25625 [bacterium]|nr:hypothetical protein [bacterium]